MNCQQQVIVTIRSQWIGRNSSGDMARTSTGTSAALVAKDLVGKFLESYIASLNVKWQYELLVDSDKLLYKWGELMGGKDISCKLTIWCLDADFKVLRL